MNTSISCVAALAMVGGAAAFVGTPLAVSQGVRTSASSMQMSASKSLPFLPAPAKLDGSMAGDVGFDPLGLSNIDDVGVDLYWLREAELKHGRVAMLATAGFLWCDTLGSLPGFPSGKCQTDVFFQVLAEKPTTLGAMAVALTVIELVSWIAINEGRATGRAAGDYNFDPLKMASSPQKMKEMQLKEVKNGRLAMMAAMGLMAQGTITHQGALDNLGNMFN